MRNKRHYNNLLDSIITFVVLLLDLSIYLLMLYYGVLHPREGTNPMVALIAGTAVFGLPSIFLLIVIIVWCFGYWFMNDKMIYSKKLFWKKKIIYLDQIEKVEKKKITAWVLGIGSSEAYIIYSGKTKITILINEKKKYKDLDDELKKYLNN